MRSSHRRRPTALVTILVFIRCSTKGRMRVYVVSLVYIRNDNYSDVNFPAAISGNFRKYKTRLWHTLQTLQTLQKLPPTIASCYDCIITLSSIPSDNKSRPMLLCTVHEAWVKYCTVCYASLDLV